MRRLNAMIHADQWSELATGGGPGDAAPLEEEAPPERIGVYRITGRTPQGLK